MPRAFLITIVIGILAAPSQAQRGSGMHGGHAGVSSSHGNGIGRRGSLHSSAPGMAQRSGHHNQRGNPGFGYTGYPYLFPDYEAPEQAGHEEEASASNSRSSAVVPYERPIPKAQVIEIPGAASLASVKPMPETVFILTSGEKVETHRYMLTANSLSITVQRQQRTIPIDMLDYDATLAANRDRGIDLRIPNDRNEISLRF